MAINSTVSTLNRNGFVKPMELAKALGLRPQQVYSYIRSGKLESIKDPTTDKILVKVESASAYVDAREAKAAETAEAE